MKITEDQLDLQRKFITERLETARADLDDLRARESVASEKRTMMENLIQWAGEFGDRLDELPDEKRRDVLRLLVDQILVDKDNKVSIILGIPTDSLMSIEKVESHGRYQTHRKTPARDLEGRRKDMAIQKGIVNGVNVDTLFGVIDAVKGNPKITAFQFRITNNGDRKRRER